MPWAPKKPCASPGCGQLTDARYCSQHEAARQQRRREADQQRGSASQRLYDYRWQQARAQFLILHPLCECDDCRASGDVHASNVVDHDEPHNGDPVKFWDQSKWRAYCKPHHDRKTARQDGGFGNKRKRYGSKT